MKIKEQYIKYLDTSVNPLVTRYGLLLLKFYSDNDEDNYGKIIVDYED